MCDHVTLGLHDGKNCIRSCCSNLIAFFGVALWRPLLFRGKMGEREIDPCRVWVGNVGMGVTRSYAASRFADLGAEGVEEVAVFHRESHTGPTQDSSVIITFRDANACSRSLARLQAAAPPTGLEWPGKRLICRYSFRRSAPSCPPPAASSQPSWPPSQCLGQPQVVPPFVVARQAAPRAPAPPMVPPASWYPPFVPRHAVVPPSVVPPFRPPAPPVGPPPPRTSEAP